MRSAVPVIALSCALGLLAAPPASGAEIPPAFSLVGAGFGHGVGMSQYGALAMAKEGRDATSIITHYYQGTQVAPVQDDQELRVNLLYQVEGARMRAEALAPDGGQAEITVGGQSLVFGPADLLIFRPTPGGVLVLRREGGASGPESTIGSGPVATLRWAGTRTPGAAVGGPTLANITNGSLDSSGHRYRYGVIEVLPAQGGASINVVNVLRLHDEYLYGISEVSSSWPDAALQAQVMAARTYALAKIGQGVRRACDCHVDDGNGPYIDQTFTGWSKASAPMGERWVAAVNATHASPTTGLAILHGGAPIQAFYQSSTGGFTSSVREVWGGNLPYAVSVPDPWSLTPDNPNRSWTVTVAQDAAARAFGVASVARLSVSERLTGGMVHRLTATLPDGTTRTISGAAMQRAFGLRSRYVNTIDGDPGAPLPGAPAAPAQPAPAQPTPSEPTATPADAAAPVTLSMRIGPTLKPREGSSVRFTGRVTPAAKGIRVERQMLQPDGTWKVMAKDRTDARGRFRFLIKKAVPAGAQHTYRLVAFRSGQEVGQSEQAVIRVRPARGR